MFNQIIEAIENCGETPTDYSGRGMYGKRCLGVVCDNPMATLLSILDSFASGANELSEVQELIQELGRPQTDSMGLSSILYFPDVKWQEPELCEHGIDLGEDCGHCVDEIGD